MPDSNSGSMLAGYDRCSMEICSARCAAGRWKGNEACSRHFPKVTSSRTAEARVAQREGIWRWRKSRVTVGAGRWVRWLHGKGDRGAKHLISNVPKSGLTLAQRGKLYRADGATRTGRLSCLVLHVEKMMCSD